MGDAIDDALADDEAEEEEERIVGQVLDEIGINFGEELPTAASGVLATETAAPAKIAEPAGGGGGGATSDDALSELEARLNNLKR